MSKKRKKRKLLGLWIFLGLLILIVGVSSILIGTRALSYKATSEAKTYLQSTSLVTVEQKDNYYSFTPLLNPTSSAIIFYPGAMVEYTAYAPLCYEISVQTGSAVYLVQMPGDFAFFDMDACEKIKNEHSEISNFYLAGHSLGGAMAASYIAKHTEEYKGLFLLASYSTADLSSSSLKVATIYGSNDGVINTKKYNECLKNLPSTYQETIINGGNHAYFASYGAQKGDNDASKDVSRQDQWTKTAVAIRKVIVGI